MALFFKVRRGYYDRTKFHRVISVSVIMKNISFVFVDNVNALYFFAKYLIKTF